MRISNEFQHYEAERQIYSVLVMHFQEGITQAEIAKLTNLSPCQGQPADQAGARAGHGRDQHPQPVPAAVRSREPLQGGDRSRNGADHADRIGQSDRRSCSRSAPPPPTCCSRLVRDGDTVCITGGKGVSAVVEALGPDRSYEVEVVPATGCVQGKHYTDVNHVATQMAEQLGGQAFLIHAPLFADSVAEKDMLMGMKAVTRRLRPRAPRPGRGARHRLDPVARIRATTTCIRAPATTAPGSRRPARRASCWRI